MVRYKPEAILTMMETGLLEDRILLDKRLVKQGKILADLSRNINWPRVKATEDFHQWAAL
jgi:hypothetical protein